MNRRKVYYVYIFAIIALTAYISFSIILYTFNISLFGLGVEDEIYLQVDYSKKPYYDCDEVKENLFRKKEIKTDELLRRELPDNWSESLRIVALGDSFTEGVEHVNFSTLYSSELEEKLTQNLNQSIKVMNYGLGGLNMREKVENFKIRRNELKPQILILQYYNDDHFDLREVRDSFIESVSDFCREHENISHRKIDEMEKKAFFRGKAEGDLKTVLSSMNELNETTDACIVLLIPIHPSIGASNKKLVKKRAEALGWKIVDMGDVYDNYDVSRIRLSKKDDHPTAFAYKLIAEELVPEVKGCLKKNIGGEDLIKIFNHLWNPLFGLLLSFLFL